ncbi:AB hydrolase-1 domain-containing protein [Favolaschia claudopus]|uniref:AB hydrolase-1 domain-containing protein n=1 Tax=Favolaschia claudopus TaxID=2862362 RepID=A0AAV9Z254_9AGAR
MPRIVLPSSDGGFDSFSYTISTPTDASASHIIQDLPTIVLLLPIFAASPLFHPIFAERQLRRFNLVTFDPRGHGDTEAKVDANYGRELLADDVLKITETLNISSFHIAGIATGGSVALQVAVCAPDRIQSVFVVSPAPQVEPKEVIQGRQEIADCWIRAHETNSTEIDEVAAEDGVYGALQFMYNNVVETPLLKALTSYGVDKVRKTWTGDNAHLIQLITVQFFLNQHPFEVSSLERIRAPVLLVHCSEDIVYPRRHAEALLELLRAANVDAKLVTLEGAPHWGNATHPEETNALLYDFVMSSCDTSKLPPPPRIVESPFLEELAQHGLVEGEADLE